MGDKIIVSKDKEQVLDQECDTYIDVTFILIGGGRGVVGANVRVTALYHQNLLHLAVVEIVQLANGRLCPVDEVEDDRRGARSADERVLKREESILIINFTNNSKPQHTVNMALDVGLSEGNFLKHEATKLRNASDQSTTSL